MAMDTRGAEQQNRDSDAREPAHIALFNIPADGHVFPNLALAAELTKRGHRVSFSIDEKHAPQVAATGATPVLYDTTFPDASRGERFPIDDVIAMSSFFLNEAITVLPQQREAFGSDVPDLVVYDYAALSAQVLAHQWGVPAVRISPTRVSARTYEDDLAPFYASVFDNPDWLAYLDRFQEFLDAGDIKISVDEFLYVGLADRYLVTIPEAFQSDAAELGDRYDFVGPIIRDEDHQADWQPPSDGRPVVLVAFGTVAPEVPAVQQIFFECAEAFADTPWHVVMSIGNHLTAEDFGPLPKNVEVIADAPQLQILSQAAAFITHAGMGSTMEAIHHGVPMVAVPLAFDQMENARLIAELGLGVRVPFEGIVGEDLRDAVEQVTADGDAADHLDAVRQRMQAAGGARTAADAIERLLEARRPGA
ncbi:macrolide family glycosyltransferase [Streptomyces sp. NPDC020884]